MSERTLEIDHVSKEYRLGAIGGTVGPQVDVADVNRKQLDVLERILEAVSRKGLEDVSDANTLNAAADAATFG